ncbi:hypothetical protein [Leifsonia sp. NPDC058248]|uniref:hypothetical protein n=1 Tax=Leifsonia sp. NPDC058248 TaxID=3346402 RepID=UPI0036DB8203
MALSDLMLRLGSQAKDLEDSVAALRTDNDAKLKIRASELRESLSMITFAFGQKVEADSDAVASRWAGLQRTVSDGFDALRTEAAARAGDPSVPADTAARRAELDAEDAIDFAVYALQEARYYVLAALAARGDATGPVEGSPDKPTPDKPAPAKPAPAEAGPDGDVAVEKIVATDGVTAVGDTLVTDGQTAVEDVVATDGDTVVETVDTIDVDDHASADTEPTK